MNLAVAGNSLAYEPINEYIDPKRLGFSTQVTEQLQLQTIQVTIELTGRPTD